MQEEIPLYAAISEMRQLTQQGQPFSLVWMGYSLKRGAVTGRKSIATCLLRKSSTREQNKYADSMLNIWDVDTKENRACWQPLIMYFNNKKVRL